jgi:hypothetical protein
LAVIYHKTCCGLLVAPVQQVDHSRSSMCFVATPV